MKAKEKHNCLRYALTAVIAVEILFIFYMNVLRCSAYPEMDMAKLYRHAIEIVRNRSFVIDGWNYITTMELDCSLLIAVPIYALSGNIYLSFGIANLIFLALFLLVIWDILKKLDVNPLYRYVSVIIFLIPYRMGMLEYFNMLFYNGGQYTVKVLIPLIVIDLLMNEDSSLFSRKNVKNLLLLILMIFLMIITSMSSGTYVLMSGIVPIIAAFVMNMILKNRGESPIHTCRAYARRNLLLLACLISFVIGYSLCRILHVSPNSEGMDLVTPHDLIDNIRVTLWGFFSVFVDPGAEGVTSLAGLMQLIRYTFAFLVIALIVYNLRHMLDRTEEADKQRLLMFPFVITFMILSLTYCCFSDVYYPERYFFIGLVPLFLTVPYFLEAVSKAAADHMPDNRLVVPALFSLLAAVMLALIPVSVLNVRTQIRTGYDGGYANVLAVLYRAGSEDITDILWLYDLPDGEVARLFAPDIRSGVINFTEDGVPFIDPARDFYISAGEASYYEGPCMMADKGGANFGRLPDDIKNACTAIGNTGGYELYMIDPELFR